MVGINDATRSPGWSLLNISGTHTVEATSAGKFTIKLVSLNGTSRGQAADFDNAQSYSWCIATASAGVSGFAPDKFTIDATAFQNSLGPVGAFSVSQSGNGLYPTIRPARRFLRGTTRTTGA